MQEGRICQSTLEARKKNRLAVNCDLSSQLFMAAEQSVCFVKHREPLPSSAEGVWVKLRDELAALQTQVRADSTVIIAGGTKDV